MSNALPLPLATFAASVGYAEDFIIGFSFNSPNGSISDLTGVSFALTIQTLDVLSVANGRLVVIGNSIIAIRPAAQKMNWGGGVYPLSLMASDGTYSRELFSASSLRVGDAGKPLLRVLSSFSLGMVALSYDQINAILSTVPGGTLGTFDFTTPQGTSNSFFF